MDLGIKRLRHLIINHYASALSSMRMADGELVGKRLGIVGGGQLGRMLGEAASQLGVDIIVLDPTPNAPASSVSVDQIVAAFDDGDAIKELAARTDRLTFEIELAGPSKLREAEADTGTPVEPAPDTLALIQDKFRQKRAFQNAGIPIPRCRAVESVADIREACKELGYPAMLKARFGGYDGRGNVPIVTDSSLPDLYEEVGGGAAMVEEFIEFTRELSVIGVKNSDERRTYTPVENIHEAEILRETVVPARCEEQTKNQAIAVAEQVLDMLEGRGVFGIELFETTDGEILVNEVAPRPHNSGHWTIEGAVTSQFEQHIRAVFDVPLGSTEVVQPIVTKNLLGASNKAQPVSVASVEPILAHESVKLHWYGKKDVRPLRKMGHISLSDPTTRDQTTLLSDIRSVVEDIDIA